MRAGIWNSCSIPKHPHEYLGRDRREYFPGYPGLFMVCEWVKREPEG
jgi:hypothetical protein